MLLSPPKNVVSQDNELLAKDQDILGDTVMVLTPFGSCMPTAEENIQGDEDCKEFCNHSDCKTI